MTKLVSRIRFCFSLLFFLPLGSIFSADLFTSSGHEFKGEVKSKTSEVILFNIETAVFDKANVSDVLYIRGKPDSPTTPDLFLIQLKDNSQITGRVQTGQGNTVEIYDSSVYPDGYKLSKSDVIKFNKIGWVQIVLKNDKRYLGQLLRDGQKKSVLINVQNPDNGSVFFVNQVRLADTGGSANQNLRPGNFTLELQPLFVAPQGTFSDLVENGMGGYIRMRYFHRQFLSNPWLPIFHFNVGYIHFAEKKTQLTDIPLQLGPYWYYDLSASTYLHAGISLGIAIENNKFKNQIDTTSAVLSYKFESGASFFFGRTFAALDFVYFYSYDPIDPLFAVGGSLSIGRVF